MVNVSEAAATAAASAGAKIVVCGPVAVVFLDCAGPVTNTQDRQKAVDISHRNDLAPPAARDSVDRIP
jgi:hypothetical protein